MSLPQFKAVIQGYEDHLFDLKCLTAYAGYWAGYYSSSKKPKPLSAVLKDLVENHRKSKKKKINATNASKPEVDVDEFLRREELFQKRMQRR